MSKVVNCIKCGGIVFKFDKIKNEFNLKTRCNHCGADQTVICKKEYVIEVIPKKRSYPQGQVVDELVKAKV